MHIIIAHYASEMLLILVLKSFFNIGVLLWYPKTYTLAIYLHHRFLSLAFLQLVQLHYMSIFYKSQNTTLLTFCYLHDKLFHILFFS
jgi:hypothetical protein